MNTASLSRCSASIWSQTLEDLRDVSPVESRAFVLEESATNLRELIDGVIALLTPFASRRDLRLCASVGRAVAETIRADGARLGQLIFHLLNRTIQLSAQGEVALVVWAEPLHPGSQRIFISVVDAAKKNATTTLLQSSTSVADDPQAAKRPADADACLPLCRILAQHMHGELSIASGSGNGPQAMFNAPFVVEKPEPATETARASASFEPFESRYLDALSEEGVDLRAFLSDWRQAMNDDLERLSALLRDGDSADFHSVLHRLSGAVGLVGARSLMEALRHASTSSLEHDTCSIEALTARARTLVTQLEATSRAYRSTSQ